jgi:DNA replication initiation complex subunit (GINS family)
MGRVLVDKDQVAGGCRGKDVNPTDLTDNLHIRDKTYIRQDAGREFCLAELAIGCDDACMSWFAYDR